MFEAYNGLEVKLNQPSATVVELEPLTNELYDELARTAKDPTKLLKAVRSVQLHTEYGTVLLLQKSVEMFAQRPGKEASQPNEYELTSGQTEILDNILPELFQNNL